MNKLDKYLDNLKEPALKQALRFILEPNKVEESVSNIGFIKLQVEDFAIMYPEFKPTKGEDKNG